MKLIICDYKMLHKHRLPEVNENIYMINFKYHTENDTFNEGITLKSTDNKWVIYADDRIKLLLDGYTTDSITIEENIFFEIKFPETEKYIPIYVLADEFSYNAYVMHNINELFIGSSNECNVRIAGAAEKDILLQKNQNDWYAIKGAADYTSFINSQYYKVSKLNNGDVIFVEGVTIIFMGNILLIDSKIREIFVNLPRFDYGEHKNEEEVTEVSEVEKNVKLFTDDQVFVHSPRLKTDIEELVIDIELPPSKSETQRVPAIFTVGSSALLFITSGTSLISSINSLKNDKSSRLLLVFEIIAFGITFITSVFLPMLMNKWEESMEKKNERKRQVKYTNYIREKSNLIVDTIKKQEEILKLNNNSLPQIINNIQNRSSEIWSREIVDNDFLNIMVGEGNIPAKITLNIPTKGFSLEDDDNLNQMVKQLSSTKLELSNVPVTISLTENIVMPIVINSKFRDDYIYSIMLQLIYYCSGKDLKLVVITNENNRNKWDFVKGLSHNWNDDYTKRYFASNEDELMQLSMILEQVYNNRIGEDDSGISEIDYKKLSDYYLIVTDDYKMTRELSVVDKIIDSQSNIGMSLLIFENTLKDLPSRFNQLINIRDEESVIINRNTMNKDLISFRASYYPNIDIDKLAYIAANIPVGMKSASSQIPGTLSFLEMFNVGRIDQLNIASRWKINDPTISLKTIIGFKESDKAVELDLHERYHGPHGLIAGSTGSGKSEFIITYILSMAVNYHPYEVQFVLIDYKGGGLAGAFENRETGIKLPHLVGTITNLDKNEMNRTLVSIKSELQRRQRVFNQTRLDLDEGTIDIYKYQRFYREGKVKEPLSHLFIISDEFAELKAQQPDFMDELVSAARIGRSLGVHLILATQKPSGVVDDQIWSNTRFRVCLKVQTTEDSNELLKRADAAYLKEAGRFYLQIGNNEIFELGQSGWTGANYVPSDNVERKREDGIIFLGDTGEVIKEINEEVKKEEEKSYGEQLGNLVKYIYNLSKRENIVTKNLWLDNIPSLIYYNDLINKYNIKSTPFSIDTLIGEYDDPTNQTQGPVILNLNTCGNIEIIGISGSGKTTLLSTIIYSSIINHNSDEINFYILDLGSEKLNIFSKAPQVGEFLTSVDQDKVKFLFYMLKDEKERRFAYYAKTGGEYLKDVEKQASPFPTIAVIINDFDVFKEQFEEIYENEFISFVRNCNKVGIVFIISTTTTNSLGFMAESSFIKKIMLNMADPDDYKLYMNNAPIPKKNAGRGIIEVDEGMYEFQVPMLFEESRYEKSLNYVLVQLASYLKKKARKVPVIPDEVTIDLFKNKIQTISSLPLGINIKTAQISAFNFDNILNIISASSHNTAKKFFPRFIEILSYLKTVKVIVINSLKDISIEVPSNIKYFDSSFKKVLEIIDSNVDKYIAEPKEDKFLIIFIGYASLQKSLLGQSEDEDDDEETVNNTPVDENLITIDSIIKKANSLNNFRFVLYDIERNISIIENTDIDALFKRKDGIWLGKDFETQSLFELLESFPDATSPNTATLIDNKKSKNIRFN